MSDLPPDLDVRATRSPVVKIAAGVGVLALGALVVLVVRFVTDKPYAKACEHLHELAKTDPDTPAAVEGIAAWVESHFVELNLKDTEHVKVGGSGMDERCEAAFALLDDGLSHTPLMKKVDCVAAANRAKDVGKCF